MKRSRIVSSFLALSMILFLLSGCGGSASPSGTGPAGSAPPAQTSAPDTTPPPAEGRSIKIGLVNPTTGKLAGFGEGCPWTENLIVDYVNKTLGGIEIDGAKLPVELIMYDSTSDTTVCAEMAQKLCEEDKVDIIIAAIRPRP
jgi:branched-chain amino acid transport system substrate-binding protein